MLPDSSEMKKAENYYKPKIDALKEMDFRWVFSEIWYFKHLEDPRSDNEEEERKND